MKPEGRENRPGPLATDAFGWIVDPFFQNGGSDPYSLDPTARRLFESWLTPYDGKGQDHYTGPQPPAKQAAETSTGDWLVAQNYRTPSSSDIERAARNPGTLQCNADGSVCIRGDPSRPDDPPASAYLPVLPLPGTNPPTPSLSSSDPAFEGPQFDRATGRRGARLQQDREGGFLGSVLAGFAGVFGPTSVAPYLHPRTVTDVEGPYQQMVDLNSSLGQENMYATGDEVRRTIAAAEAPYAFAFAALTAVPASEALAASGVALAARFPRLPYIAANIGNALTETNIPRWAGFGAGAGAIALQEAESSPLPSEIGAALSSGTQLTLPGLSPDPVLTIGQSELRAVSLTREIPYWIDIAEVKSANFSPDRVFDYLGRFIFTSGLDLNGGVQAAVRYSNEPVLYVELRQLGGMEEVLENGIYKLSLDPREFEQATAGLQYGSSAFGNALEKLARERLAQATGQELVKKAAQQGGADILPLQLLFRY